MSLSSSTNSTAEAHRRDLTEGSGLTRVVDAATIGRIVSKLGGLRALHDMAIERIAELAVSEDVNQRERDGFALHVPHDGLLEWMPAVRQGSTVSVKLVGYNPHNPRTYGLPTILSTLCAFDVATGHLRSVVDGTFLTAIRTGAASAVASRVLADPASSVLGLVGCGAQAVTQLHALSRIYAFTEVLVFDKDLAVAETFSDRARVRAGLVRVASLSELEERSDIICTATSVLPGEAPVLSGQALKPSVHVNAIGSDLPGKIELPLDLLRAATVCPDDVVQARREGECQQLTPDEIGPTLFDLLRAPATGQRLRGRRTVYDSTGLAMQDLVMIELIEDLSEQFGLGELMAIESSSGDPRDPYAFLRCEGADWRWADDHE
jgi:ornithine cyclodeaminase/alanine dehydrogenase-like protein (mu-crystallin family)